MLTPPATPLTIPKLPYPMDALAPHISGETLCFIHQQFMPALASQITLPKDNTLMDYLNCKPNNPDDISYKSATELYNHSFWLAHLAPTPSEPRPSLSEAIVASFGSLDKLYSELHKAAHDFDNRWLWLACQITNPSKLVVVATVNRPLEDSLRPIAVCNLWQHAYYLDYRNRKSDYINAYLQHLINWHKAEMTWTDSQRWSPSIRAC